MQLERRLIARLKTANIRFTDAQVERIWAIVLAHQAGLSIRKIAGATGLSSSRIHQLLNAPEAKEIPVWLSQLRQSSRGSDGKKKAERTEPETEIRSRPARRIIPPIEQGQVTPQRSQPMQPQTCCHARHYVCGVWTGRSGGCFAAPSQQRNGVGYPEEELRQRRDYEGRV